MQVETFHYLIFTLFLKRNPRTWAKKEDTSNSCETKASKKTKLKYGDEEEKLHPSSIIMYEYA